MLDMEELKKLGEEAGFTHVAALDCSTIKLLPEVRQMCASNTCHMYGKNWHCPPGCGTLEECEARVRSYRQGILVQTVGELEDSMDGEGMMEAEKAHKEHFFALEEKLRSQYPKMLTLPAASRIRPSHPWKLTACWSPRYARTMIFPIITGPVQLHIPVVFCLNK